jgi:hypothetical protein
MSQIKNRTIGFERYKVVKEIPKLSGYNVYALYYRVCRIPFTRRYFWWLCERTTDDGVLNYWAQKYHCPQILKLRHLIF